MSRHVLENLYSDIRFSWRTHRRYPFASVAAIAVLGTAIGSTSAVFALFDALVFRPPPVGLGERVVSLGGLLFNIEGIRDGVSWWEQATSFENLASYHTGEAPVEGSEGQWARVTVVSPRFFSVFGQKPAAGRYFSIYDDQGSQDRVAVVSLSFCRAYFGTPQLAIGRHLRLGGTNHVVVGVASEGFDFPSSTEIWLPREVAGRTPPLGLSSTLVMGQWQPSRGRWVGKLREGTSLSQARSELYLLQQRLQLEFSARTSTQFKSNISVVPLRTVLARDYGASTGALFAASILVFCIATANVSLYLLGIAVARQKETAIKLALGANLRRILGHLALETIALSSFVCLVAIGLAIFVLAIALRIMPKYLVFLPPLASFVGISTASALLLSVLAAILMFALPAFQFLRSQSLDALKDQQAQFGSRPGRLARRFLIALEVAVAFALSVSGVVGTISYMSMSRLTIGFEPKQVLIVPIDFSGSPIEAGQIPTLLADLMESTKNLPAVKAVGVVSDLPVSGSPGGYQVKKGELGMFFVSSLCGGDYFRAVGIPILKGRSFSASERNTVIISEDAANSFWGGGNPIGQELWIEGEKAPRMVVGVVGKTRPLDMNAELVPQIYLPFAGPYRGELRQRRMHVAVKCSADCNESFVARIKDIVQSKGGYVRRIQGLDEMASAAVAPSRARAAVLAAYAAIGLSVTMVGVFAFVSHLSLVRRQELAIRMALGARPLRIMFIVLRESMVWASIGILAGIGLSLFVSKLWQGLVFGIEPYDLSTFSLGATLMLGGCALASLPSAIHAALSVPADILRQE